MAAYQIVRIEREPCAANAATEHVVAVATGDATLYSRLWGADEVLQGIDRGDSFYTQPAGGASRYPAACAHCSTCGRAHVTLQRFDGPTVTPRPHW
jgi:hypothetical protein